MIEPPFMPTTINVLGLDEDGRILIWDTDYRRLYEVVINDLNRSKIIQLCGLEEFTRLEIELSLDDDDANLASVIRDGIAELSRRRVFVTMDRIGQGVWQMPDGDGLLLVAGNVPANVIDENNYSIIKEPLVGDDKLLELTGRKWIDHAEVLVEMNAVNEDKLPYGGNLWAELTAALACWNFDKPYSLDVVAGLIIATSIQAVLDFRPHVWVTGGTNVGKSALKTFLHRLWPYAIECEGRTSEAAIRQTLGASALPLLMDEQENWYGLNGVLRLLRSSSRGGSVRKGTQSGKAVEYKVAVIAWMFAIMPDLREEADRNRFISIGLLPPVKINMPTVDVLKNLGLRILACAMANAVQIRKVWNELIEADEVRAYGRLAEGVAVPLAVKAVLIGKSTPEIIAELLEILSSRKVEIEDHYLSDEQDLILAINRISFAGKYTVADLLDHKSLNWVVNELAFVGIRRLDGGKVYIATHLLAPHLPKGRWADADIGMMLKRLPGAQPDRQKIGPKNQRGFTFPLRTFIDSDGHNKQDIVPAKTKEDYDDERLNLPKDLEEDIKKKPFVHTYYVIRSRDGVVRFSPIGRMDALNRELDPTYGTVDWSPNPTIEEEDLSNFPDFAISVLPKTLKNSTSPLPSKTKAELLEDQMELDKLVKEYDEKATEE